MPNLTTPFLNLGGTDINKDMDDVQNWSIALIDELKYMFCNLDAGNCQEAAKVKAQNIDCTKARIKSAQIQSLQAHKIKTGTLDVSDKVTIQGESDAARMTMNAQTLIFYDKDEQGREIPRIYMGFDSNSGKYVFEVYNKEGQEEIHMNDDGNVVFCGTISGGKIESETDINITKDATVGKRIILQDQNNLTMNYEEAGIISVNTGIMQIIANNHRSINLNTDGNIDLNGNSVKINGMEVATQADMGSIEKSIKNWVLENFQQK